jgi:hypothetical protein
MPQRSLAAKILDPRRVARVSLGLLRPSTRPAYVAALRRRAKLRPSNESCLVCGRKGVAITSVTSAKNPAKTFRMRVCGGCGHVANPENIHDYRKFPELEALPLRARIGTQDRKGREFQMAEMGLEILDRDGVSVMVYGAGRSLDNHHIAALPQVNEVAVSDVMKLRDDAEFFDCNKPSPRPFTLVVASEVVEHFLNPSDDFPILFSFVEDDGLLVCCTNIYDGGNLAKQPYVFIEGHTSYYTKKALQVIADRHDYFIDFRTPLVATGYGGPRKRYVLFSKSREVMNRIPEYFKDREYAPSERPWANKELAEKLAEERAAAKRKAAEA